MDGGNDWLEAVLKRNAFQETPMKILEVEEGGDAPGKGENFLSKIQKIRAKVLLGSGRTKNLSLLIKNEPISEHLKKLSVEGGIFHKEITMYRDVLPKMQELLDDIKDPYGIFWAQYYDIRMYDRLVFEDLGTSGYRMAPRKEQLSLNAALMAVQQFAKFHALSRVLLDRGEIPMTIFRDHVWMKTPELQERLKSMVVSNVKNMCKTLATWGDEWTEAIQRLGAADLRQLYIESNRTQLGEFAVLCHGDAWINNMMFQGNDLENPTACRLLDFQICFLNSPARDLSQFFISSVRLEDQKNNTELLVQTYLGTLKSYLLKLGFKGDIPTAEDMKTSLKRRAAMRLNDAIGFVPVVLGDAEGVPSFEEVIRKIHEAKDEGVEPEFGEQIKLTPKGIAIIKHEIRTAMESGVI